jgi:predicted DNA-binding transcriptional regulator AlpA
MTKKSVVEGKQAADVLLKKRIEEFCKELVVLTKDVDYNSLFLKARQMQQPELNGRQEISAFQVDVDRLIRLKEVLEYIPVSKSSWWSGVKSGRYPAPVHHLGPRVTAWRLSAIKELVGGEVANHE